MELGEKSSVRKEILGFSAAAIVFFQLNFFLLIFVIPLAVLYRRRGFIPGVTGSLITLAVIAGIKIYRMASIEGAAPRFDLLGIDLIVPLTFLLGLALVEAPHLDRFRLYHRLLGATVAAGVVSVPLLRFVLSDPEFDAILRAQIGAMIRAVTEEQGAGSLHEVPFSGTEQVVRLSRLVFLNTYLAGYFLTLAANWVIGTRFARRISGLSGEFPPYTRFRLPDAAVWPFLLGWTVVFIGLFRDLGVARMIAWNVALVLSILFGCQGVGIIKTWTSRMNRGMRLAVTFFFLSLVFVPGLNLIVLAGVPLLGVSELWIQYRNKERS